jgi:hypothetical protein
MSDYHADPHLYASTCPAIARRLESFSIAGSTSMPAQLVSDEDLQGEFE